MCEVSYFVLDIKQKKKEKNMLMTLRGAWRHQYIKVKIGRINMNEFCRAKIHDINVNTKTFLFSKYMKRKRNVSIVLVCKCEYKYLIIYN